MTQRTNWVGNLYLKLQNNKLTILVREHSLSQALDEFQRGSKRIALLCLKCRRKVDRNTKKSVNPTADELKKWKDQAA